MTIVIIRDYMKILVVGITLNNTNDILFNLLKNLKYPVLIQEFINSDSFSAAYINGEFIAFNKQIIMNNTYIGNIIPYKI